MKTIEETRERLLAYVTIARATLAVNPNIGLQQFSRQVGCGANVGQQLKAMGVIVERTEEEGGGYAWKSDAATETVVDNLIVHRRKENEAQRPNAQAELGPLIAAWEEKFAALEIRCEAAERAADTANARAGLSEEDKELLNLALNDEGNKKARLDQMEINVGELLRRVGDLERKPASVIARPAPPAKLWRIGVIGIFERDMRHVEDGVKAIMNGQAKFVQIVRIDHVAFPPRHPPSNLDALIVTPDANMRAHEVGKTYAHATFRVSGGVKSIAAQVATIVKGGA